MEVKDENGLTEEEFLATYSSEKYPKPSLTADVIIYDQSKNSLLMIQRKNHPYIGHFAFPGGFANPGECIEESAARELEEETCVTGLELIPLGFFSKPGRDPRGWVVTQAFLSIIKDIELPVRAADDAADAKWFEVEENENEILLKNGDLVLRVTDDYSDLAFDHDDILRKALKLIKEHI